MNQYSIGKIYKIICIKNPDIIYVGCTFFKKIENVFRNHKRRYSIWKNGWVKGGFDKISIMFPIFRRYHIRNFKIVLIKEYTVCRNSPRDLVHLEAYEQLWINKVGDDFPLSQFLHRDIYPLRTLYGKLNREDILNKMYLKSQTLD